MDAELRGLEKAGEISGQSGLAFGNERVVEPGRGHESSGKDALRWKRSRVVEGIVQGDELASLMSCGSR